MFWSAVVAPAAVLLCSRPRSVAGGGRVMTAHAARPLLGDRAARARGVPVARAPPSAAPTATATDAGAPLLARRRRGRSRVVELEDGAAQRSPPPVQRRRAGSTRTGRRWRGDAVDRPVRRARDASAGHDGRPDAGRSRDYRLGPDATRLRVIDRGRTAPCSALELGERNPAWTGLYARADRRAGGRARRRRAAVGARQAPRRGADTASSLDNER